MNKYIEHTLEALPFLILMGTAIAFTIYWSTK